MRSLFVALHSSLARKLFLAILSYLFVIFFITYLFSVPLIKQKVYEIEKGASRLALDNVLELTSRMYMNIEEFRVQALEAHQQQLRVAVSLAESLIISRINQTKEPYKLQETLEQAFRDIRNLSYGNNDYIWVADYKGQLLSHPESKYLDGSSAELHNELKTVKTVVDKAIADGEGYYKYRWSRLSEDHKLDKVSYVKSYPEWKIVIGSGVYLPDLNQQIKSRKEAVILDLRDALTEIKIAKTGYLYVFDSDKNMLIHPNKSLEGENTAKLINPLTNGYIIDELIDVADTNDELQYLWDKPDESGNYIYRKISLVRYHPGFDWYICSSVYIEELQSSSETLTSRLVFFGILTAIGSLLTAAFFVLKLTEPLKRLTDTATNVQLGNLSARSGISGSDELGTLGSSFDDMIERVEKNISTLDTQVKQRTDELLETNSRAHRMHAVGQLAGGMAHDFNNLLSTILGNLLFARESFGTNKSLDSLLTPAIRATRRGADITHRLLTFSRRQPLQPLCIDVNRLLYDTTRLLRSSLPSNITLNFKPCIDEAWVDVDPGHLESTVINLALNARDAMPDGGTLRFSTDAVTIDNDDTEYDDLVPRGEYVIITVTDTGCGFTEKALKFAYEPFFTTKPDDDNSGLGLSMVYGFIKQSSGFITISSKPSQGSSIRMLLPKSESTSQSYPSQASNISTHHAIKDMLFLLVEDNDGVRAVVRKQLNKLEINVIEAASAEEARKLIETIPTLEGIVTDIMFEGSPKGIELANTFREVHANGVVLLISGFFSKHEHDDIGSLPYQFLPKPFDDNRLADALNSACLSVLNRTVS